MYTKNILRNLSVASVIATIAIIIGVLAGYQKVEDEKIDSSELDLSMQMLVNAIIDNDNLNKVIYSTYESGIQTIKIAPIVSINRNIPILKSGSEYVPPDSSWSKYNKNAGTNKPYAPVDGKLDTMGMGHCMVDKYGNNCYEMRIEPARDANGNLIVDKNGNPTGAKDVYHKSCQ